MLSGDVGTYARGCGVKGVICSVSCRSGLNWTVCLCDSDNCNSQDKSVQLLALAVTTSTTTSTTTATTTTTSRTTYGPTHKFNTTKQREELFLKETTTRSSTLITNKDYSTPFDPNAGVISLL